MKRVLVVEDNKDEILLFKTILAKTECLAHVTNNPYEGLQMTINGDCDILVTDIAMPVLDGFMIVETVRKVNKEIPIVVVSCHVGEHIKQKAFELGANYFVEKPFSINDFLRVINNIYNEINSK